jgi:hypothetical protein
MLTSGTLSVAKFSQKFCEMAIQKDVPLDTVAQHLMSCIELYSIWHSTVNFLDTSYTEPLQQFIQVMVNYLHNVPLGNVWVRYTHHSYHYPQILSNVTARIFERAIK